MIWGITNVPATTVAERFRNSRLEDFFDMFFQVRVIKDVAGNVFTWFYIVQTVCYNWIGVPGTGTSKAMSTGPISIFAGPRSISDLYMSSQVTSLPV